MPHVATEGWEGLAGNCVFTAHNPAATLLRTAVLLDQGTVLGVVRLAGELSGVYAAQVSLFLTDQGLRCMQGA